MAKTWAGTDAGLLIDTPDPEPEPLAREFSDGDWVSARLLGWDGRTPSGEDPFVLPDARTVTGVLTIIFVEALDSWRYSVNGQSVDPTSVDKLAGPSDPPMS